MGGRERGGAGCARCVGVDADARRVNARERGARTMGNAMVQIRSRAGVVEDARAGGASGVMRLI